VEPPAASPARPPARRGFVVQDENRTDRTACGRGRHERRVVGAAQVLAKPDENRRLKGNFHGRRCPSISNDEDFARLQQGAAIRNNWRAQYRARIDLSGANVREGNFRRTATQIVVAQRCSSDKRTFL
jgi:hypothetical protein